MANRRSESTSVIIVGGSLVGLSTALCLAAHDVKSVILERHSGSHPHPRAIGFTPRTMEVFRALGFQHQIKEADPDFKLMRARVDSLAGKWHETLPWTESQDTVNPLDYSVSSGAAIPQDQLEKILRAEAATRSQIELRYSNALVGFTQDDEHVCAIVKDKSGGEYELRAPFMVAADGNRSQVRQELGIEREGEKDGKGKMGTITSVMFRAPLDQYLTTGVTQFNIEQPGMKAFMTHYMDGRWALMFTDGKERSTAEQDAAIYEAIGRKDISVERITTGQWELSMLIADHFRRGRVFLAGDAAHTLPPNRGGFGANTGIADAWNLAWKLAAVLAGAAQPQLLDTYEAERRPIALLRKEQITLRRDYKAHIKTEAGPGKVIDDVAMEVGELYRSDAVDGAPESLPVAQKPEEWNGQPGTRAAHVWMSKDGKRVSSLDLYGHHWVLVSDDAAWKEAAEAVSRDSSVKVEPVQIGTQAQPEDAAQWRRIMGLTATGASLIRPDGIIAWRSEELSGNAVEQLRAAVHKVAMPTRG